MLTGSGEGRMSKHTSILSRGSKGLMCRLAASLLLGILATCLVSGPADAQRVGNEVICKGALPTQALRLGAVNAAEQQPNLVVKSLCTVNKAGDYLYGQVNIVKGGSLIFVEPAGTGTQVNFWASSVIVE